LDPDRLRITVPASSDSGDDGEPARKGGLARRRTRYGPKYYDVRDFIDNAWNDGSSKKTFTLLNGSRWEFVLVSKKHSHAIVQATGEFRAAGKEMKFESTIYFTDVPWPGIEKVLGEKWYSIQCSDTRKAGDMMEQITKPEMLAVLIVFGMNILDNQWMDS
jgi:hypothetical protein